MIPTNLPWYEYLVTALWVVLTILIGLAKHYKWEDFAGFLLIGLVGFTIGLFWLRRHQWVAESWEGILVNKRRVGVSFFPLFDSTYEIDIKTSNGIRQVRVGRGVYKTVEAGHYLVKKPGTRDVIFYEYGPPT